MPEKVVKIVKLATGVLIILLLLCQLFTFEKFPGILLAVGINSSMSLVVMIVLVITELMSLPFFIGMEISRLVILVSRAAGFISLGAMTMIGAMAVLNGAPTVIFGATLKNVSGLVGVLMLAIMWALLMIANVPTKKTSR
jgi:hypothetical protein